MSNLTAKLQAGGLTGILEHPEREIDLLACIAGRALERARARGADAAEVSLSSNLGRAVDVRLGELETVEDARDRGITVTVYAKRCCARASSGELTPEGINEVVERAMAIARHTQPDPAAGLADAGLIATVFPELDLWHPEVLDIDTLTARALAMEEAGLAVDARVDNSEGASMTFDAGVGVLANSHGFVGPWQSTRYGQHCVLVGRDGDHMQRDWWWDRRRVLSELDAPEMTGRRAAERTLARLGARPVKTGRVPVLFSPEVAGGLIGNLVSAVSGGNLYRRSSFLLDACGEQLFPEWVSLVERPLIPRGPSSAAFDSDGVATREAALVEQGVLRRYLLGTYSARRLGLQTTGNADGVRNLCMTPGNLSQQELIGQMQRGLVVTEVMGQGVNLVTGDYSRGASGFWVENGRIVHAVEEITIAGNLRDMFRQLQAAGNDVETRRNIQVPSLLLGEMMVASAD